MMLFCHLTAYKALPPVAICKSPAVFLAVAVQLVLSSLSLQAIFLGSLLDPIATKCLSFVTIIAWHPVGEFVICVAIVSGDPDPASGRH